MLLAPTCPRCGSANQRRAGWRYSKVCQPRQQFVCDDCKKWWASPAKRGRPSQPKLERITVALHPDVTRALELNELNHYKKLDAIINHLLKGYLAL